MSDEQRGSEAPGTAGPADEGRTEGETQGGEGEEGGRKGFSDGVRQGLGVLSAFKEAMEETIRDARERGDLSADRAREMMQGAMSRAREAAGEAKERLDFVTHQEFEGLSARVEELRVRLENLERRVPQDPSAGPSRPAAEEAGEA
jgi:polyhydroxyalkanoate synthesis regulator phasin